MKSLIITADDYGMHDIVNRAIDAGIEAGLITTTNVMTGMPVCEEARKLREKYPNISIGLHWTLSAGKSVCDQSDIPSLLAENGEFYPYPEFCARYKKGLIRDKDIKKELLAQYNKFVELCGKPDYWNTHQNVHVAFKLMPLFVEIAEELQIHKMRSHQRIDVPASDGTHLPMKRRIVEPVKRMILDNWMKKAKKAGMSAPDGLLFLINEEKDKNDIAYLFQNIVWKNAQCAELVIHPARYEGCKYFGKITEQRIKEYQLYTNEATAAEIAKNKIQLISFAGVRG